MNCLPFDSEFFFLLDSVENIHRCVLYFHWLFQFIVFEEFFVKPWKKSKKVEMGLIKVS